MKGANDMKTYIIDYKTESGRCDFQSVEANDLERAIEIFRKAGKSWLGTDFATVEITAVAER